MQPYRKNNFLPGMDASILVLCANWHFTGVTVTFYRCFGRFTGFRDGQGEICLNKAEGFVCVIPFFFISPNGQNVDKENIIKNV